METLLRFVIDATGLSRRKAFAAIREGRVWVNRVPVVDPSSPYDGGEVTLDGRVLRRPVQAKTYLLLNKPVGVLTTRLDELGRTNVLDLVPAELRRPGLHPVGRLDRDTGGLLILTDDGDLTFRLTHPRHEVEKEYWVGLAEEPEDALLVVLERGVSIDGELRRPLRVEWLEDARPFQISVTIREGRNRQVRRMFEAVDARITRLRRVREGPLHIGALPEGAVRPLSRDEVASLFGEA